MTIEELQNQLAKLIDDGEATPLTEVRICNLDNDDEACFHFREIYDIEAVTIRRGKLVTIYIED